MKKYKLWLSILLIFSFIYLFFLPVLADENTPISMDFKGADLRDVFRTLAQIAEVNLITHQSVQGEITLTLTEVPFLEAVNLIAIANDLEYRWVGNTLLIAEPAEIHDTFSRTLIETFDIQYADLDKIKAILEGLMVDRTITVDTRTQTLMVISKEAEMQIARDIIAKLDVPVPQVFLEVRVEELSTTALDKIGVQQGSYAKLRLLSDAQGLITDLALDLPSIVEALKQDGIARTLANPSLVTLDGQTSKLLIGDKIPVESQELIDGQMQTVITYIQAGIQLEFTPRISADNYITLNIKPQISSLGEYLTKGYPLIRSRELETIVRIKDGETFVIGGLIREDDRQSLEKVPILGDIPILGALFKHTEDSKQSTDIIIFITPKIIYPGDENYFKPEEKTVLDYDDEIEQIEPPSGEQRTLILD